MPGWSAIAIAGLRVSEHPAPIAVVWWVSAEVLPKEFADSVYASDLMRVGAKNQSDVFVVVISLTFPP
jgi:hypothetical protein